jgi:hypothetical protein
MNHIQTDVSDEALVTAPSAFGTYHSLRSGTRPPKYDKKSLNADSKFVASDLGEDYVRFLPRTISPPKRGYSLHFRELHIRPDRTCFVIAFVE